MATVEVQTLPLYVTDLDFFTDESKRYELINGELFVTLTPHWKHQNITGRIGAALTIWSDESKLGEAASNPGLIFSKTDSVIPDVVWCSYSRLSHLMDDSGHLKGAPELVVEVLSPGEENEQRDRDIKLKLYSNYGVLEYWIIDRFSEKVEVYRRDRGILKLALTLYSEDELTSHLLPGFKVIIQQIF